MVRGGVALDGLGMMPTTIHEGKQIVTDDGAHVHPIIDDKIKALENGLTAALLRVSALEKSPPTEPPVEPPTSNKVPIINQIEREQHRSPGSSIQADSNDAAWFWLPSNAQRWHAGGYRCEVHNQDHMNVGTERWHGFSFMLPDDYKLGTFARYWNDRIILQYADEGSPMFSLNIIDDRLKVRRKDETGEFDYLYDAPLMVNHVYNAVIHVAWERDVTGLFELWLDGFKVVEFHGETLAERNTTYTKWGIYGQPTLIWYANHRIASGPNKMEVVKPN